MSEITENIAKNIQKLRKVNGWKQSELAEKLNYTDKAISKWERGESVPDIDMLASIANIFNVTVNYLITAHSDSELESSQKDKGLFVRNFLIMILYCVSVYLIASILFTTAALRDPNEMSTWWCVFIFAIPICALIVYVYGKRSSYWLVQLISISLFIWTFIAAFYCLTVVLKLNSYFWLLFIIGAPLQGIICLYAFYKRKRFKKRNKDK